ncbi:MAG: leucyl aminopeptidase family protein [Proteobacteria bacterium]|nr:leucyl aminopeptidase family protein [Pseudomonadota bacterium]
MVDAGRLADLHELPHGALLQREQARLRSAPGQCFSVSAPTRAGLRIVVGLRPERADAFQVLTLAARMVKEVAAARPPRLGIAALADARRGDPPAAEALLAALAAATEGRPQQKSRPPRPWSPRVAVCGAAEIARTGAIESGARLTRWLAQLPPNVLYPGSYRRVLGVLARRHRWRMRVYGERELRRLGAGAFLAVAQGSPRRDAALVKLEYRPAVRRGRGSPAAPLALVGKGLCFDTGGLNLKSPKSMLDMHGDMTGSAVALGILAALTETRYPRPVDAWLALAENRIGPDSYTQQDVVTAANGTTIQVMHTDAEGRMVLADALAIASRSRPALIIDFATLTGACITALTERISGVFTNDPALRDHLEGAGRASGERVWNLPLPADFDDDLDSPVADVVQCLLDGKGDHIYAGRFLSRFVGAGIPWVHVDLSAAERAGGLAHAPGPATGFGVRFATTLLNDPAFLRALARRPGAR